MVSMLDEQGIKFHYPRGRMAASFFILGFPCFVAFWIFLSLLLSAFSQRANEKFYESMPVFIIFIFFSFLFMLVFWRVRPIKVSEFGVSIFIFGYEKKIGEWKQIKKIENISFMRGNRRGVARSVNLVFQNHIVRIQDFIVDRRELCRILEDYAHENNIEIIKISSLSVDIEKSVVDEDLKSFKSWWGQKSVILKTNSLDL